MKRKYETPSLPGTAIHRTAKVLKVDNIRTKQTPLMKLAMSSNKLFNSTSLPTTPEGRREGEDESEFNELSPRGASLSQAGRGGQWPQGASATITGGPRVHRSAQSIEDRGYLSGFFQTPCSPSTLFLIEERKTGSIRNNSDPSYAWVAGRRAGGVKYQEQAVGDFTAARMIGCLTLVLSSAGLSIHNGATDEVETVPGVGAFEVFGNRFVVMFSVRNFMVYLYEYSELESRLSLAVPPISTAGKVFCSFAWTASGRAFLSDDSARLYELTDGYTRIRCVASPLRPSILSAVASFIQTALTLPFGIGGAASRNRSPQMKLFCDDSRGLLYAFDAATTLVTVYSTSGSQGTVTQIGSGRCPGLDDDDIGAPAQAPAQALPRTVVMVAPVEATVSPFVNFVVVYASGIIDFFSVEEGGITLRYRRSAATLLRAATPIQGLSAVAHRIAAAVAEVSTNGIVVNDAVYNDGSFVFVVTAGSETLVLHSTSTDLVVNNENVCYVINVIVGEETLVGNAKGHKWSRAVLYQDAVNYLRTPTVSIDSCLSGFSEDEELLALLTLYRRKSDSVDQLFKDPATFRVLSSKAPAQAVETRRSYPINKLEQFLRARSQNLTHFLQILYPAEVFAMAMGLYCRAGFAHSPNPALVVPIPIPALASEESPSPDTKTLADASKSLYTTFMGDSGAMFRLEGTSLFLARLFQRIWPCCICECSQGKYSTIFTPKWTHDEILSSYTYVTRAQELVYSVPERCFPLSAARQVGALRRLLATTSSTLGLMLTLTENDLQKVVRRLSLEDQLLFSKLRVFQLAEQSNLIFALLSALIDTSLDSFNKTCGDLLERCPMFFTDVELARFRGTYALVRMKESARAQEQYPQKDIEDLAERSFAEFSKVPMLNVDHICRVYESFGLFDYVVKLALGRAQNCELRPETLALLFTPSKGPGEHNKFSNDTEELRKIAYKKSCYKVVLSLFSFLKTGVFPDVARRKSNKLPIKVSANETRRLVALAQEFKDKMWHFELYQWYLENGLEQELLDITSTAGYVIEFLNSDSGRTGLLWKYYIRQGRNEKGISCLYEKAMSSSEGIPIERRIEYFSIILNLLRVLKDTTADQHMRTSEVLTNFELLKLQQEVLRVGDAGVLTEEERAELSTKALSFTELRSLVERKENYKFYVLSIEFIRLERSTASTLQKIRATYSGKILKDFNLPALVACAKRFYTEFTGDDSAADLYFPVEFVLETLTEQYYKNSEEFLTALLDLKSSKRSLCVPVFNFYARKFRAASGATGDNKRANDWLRWVAFIADHIASFTERDERTVGTVLNFISDLTTKKQNNQQVDQMILTSLADTRNKLLF